MKRCFQVALLLVPLLAAQPLPPLIDRELLFGSPEITGAQISPDGKYVTFVKAWKGALNVWIKKTGEPFSGARPLTAEAKNPVSSYVWTRDGKYVCYVKAEGGENSSLYAVDPSAAAPEGAAAPPSRDLAKLKGAAIQLYGASQSDPDLVYAGINDRDRAWPDLYKVKVSTAARILMRENTEQIFAWFFDSSGRVAPGPAHRGERRSGTAASRTQHDHQDLLLQRLRDLHAAAVPQGR